MSNVTELRPRAATGEDAGAHIPTASPKPTTTKVANAVQQRMSDEQVGKRKPPEPTSETLSLAGGAQTIAVGKGRLRNLERGQILEVVVHCTVVEAGGVRDKIGKEGAVADSVAKVVASIDRFDEVKIVGQVDVDSVQEDHPGDAPAAEDVEFVTCHRCEGKGSHHAPGDEPDPCDLCEGKGSIPKPGDDEEVIDVEGTEEPGDEVPALEAGSGDEASMFEGGPTPPTDPLPEPPTATSGLEVGNRETYTEANLRAKSTRKPDLLAVWKDLSGGRELPSSITKPQVLDAILKVQAAGQGAASAEGEQAPDDTAMQVTSERYAGAIEEGAADGDEPTAEEPGEEPPLQTGGADLEDGYTTGKVVECSEDGSDVVAEVDAEGIRVFVHARSGQAFDTLEQAVKFSPKAPVEGEGSDPAPAAEVDGQAPAEVEGSDLTFDEASALTPTDLAQRSDEQLVDVAVALGVDRKQAASLNRPALLAVIEREQVPF